MLRRQNDLVQDVDTTDDAISRECSTEFAESVSLSDKEPRLGGLSLGVCEQQLNGKLTARLGIQ